MKKLMAGLLPASAARFRGAAREASKGLGSLFWVLLVICCVIYVVSRAFMLVAIAAVAILGFWFVWGLSRFLFDLSQSHGDRNDRLNRPGRARREIMADEGES